jgi:hypothetical protein
MPQRSRSTGRASTRHASSNARGDDDPLPVSDVSSSPAGRALQPRLRSVAEAAPERIVPAASAPVAIAGTGIARAETELRPIGVIGARHIIIASTITTIAATIARSGCIGSTIAAAARSRRDDDGADRDWIGGWNENGAAAAAPTDATPGIGIISEGRANSLLALGRQRKVTRSYAPQVSVGLMPADWRAVETPVCPSGARRPSRRRRRHRARSI